VNAELVVAARVLRTLRAPQSDIPPARRTVTTASVQSVRRAHMQKCVRGACTYWPELIWDGSEVKMIELPTIWLALSM
jgi:hypothetical protein